MTDSAVVVVGGGPTGLMLGAELTLAGVDVVVVEKQADPERVGAGALGLHARTLEVFDQRGIVDRFLEAGTPAQVNGFAGVRFDIGGFPSRPAGSRSTTTATSWAPAPSAPSSSPARKD